MRVAFILNSIMNTQDIFMAELLKNIVKPKCKENADVITRVMINSMNADSIKHIVYLSQLEKPYYLFRINDYCIINNYPRGYETNTIGYDNLIDVGLSTGTGTLYGKIIRSDDYSSDYKDYSPNFIVGLLLLDDEGVVYTKEKSINILHLTKINKFDIPYFKLNGTDK